VALERIRLVETKFASVLSENDELKTNFAKVSTEFARLSAEHSKLQQFHRSALKVMGLLPADIVPLIEESAPEKGIVEQHESMPAGPDRIKFFEANRDRLFKAANGKSQ
jgi:hypothetical protein